MTPETPTTRRTVVRQLILGTAVSLIGGLLRSQSVLAVDLPAMGSVGTLVLKTSQFPTLLNIGGSVRLNVGLDYPIVLSRGADNRFYAVSTMCQHAGCIVNAYDPTLGLIQCTCHGSTFQIDGTLVDGPAQSGLDAYATVFDGNQSVSVQLPGVTFAARQIAIESVAGDTRRLSLVFNPVIFASYQVQFRSDLSGAAQTIPFATTPTGPANQTSYVNRNINNLTPTVTLYVDMATPKGFFQIVQVVTEY